MVAMLAAFGAEVGSHKAVFQQIQTAPLLIGGAFALVIIGSIVPVVRKADLSINGAGPFTQVLLLATVWQGQAQQLSVTYRHTELAGIGAGLSAAIACSV